MFQFHQTAFVVILLTVVETTMLGSRAPADDDPETILAGRTVKAYSAQIVDDDRTVRLRAARSLAAMGPPAEKVLVRSLGHDDPAIRYIAAVGLGRIGGDTLKSAHQSLEALAIDERSHAARMAASFALCRGGDTTKHLQVLIDALNHPQRGVVCAAAELIADIGPPAREATEELLAVYAKNKPGVKGGDYHRGGAAMNALRKIDPERFK